MFFISLKLKETETAYLIFFQCVLECVFNRTGLADLDENGLVNMVAEGTADVPEWNSKANEIVSECLASSKLFYYNWFYIPSGLVIVNFSYKREN